MSGLRDTIEAKVGAALSPTHLEVVNESHKHNVPPGSEMHFKLVVVADAFAGRPRLDRHRLLNHLLADELRAGIHALALQTFTPEEWAAREGRAAASPPCLGGAKPAA